MNLFSRKQLTDNISLIRQTAFQMAPFWVAAAMTAMVSIIFSRVYGWCEERSIDWVSDHPIWAFVLAPVAMLISYGLTHFISPFANGSGIPQLIAAVEISRENHPLIKRLLEVKMVFVKFVGSCVCVIGGAVIGREGPMLQMSAGIFHWVQEMWPESLSKKPNIQSMILAGGAAGLASAFNTPLGGIVFAIEELAKVHISHIRTYVFHAVVISGLIAQAVLGNYLYFGKNPIESSSSLEIFPFVAACILIGLAGAFFGTAMVAVLDWRAKLSARNKFLMTFVFGLLVATLIYIVKRPAVGGGRLIIIDLLSLPAAAPWYLGIVRFLANYLAYAGGVIGGIFAPALSTGAAFGSWMSTFFPSAHMNLWALGGMVAFLTGVTRTPFTSIILVLEMSDSHNVIVYLMLAGILAQSAARFVDNESFYEHMAHRLIKRELPDRDQTAPSKI